MCGYCCRAPPIEPQGVYRSTAPPIIPQEYTYHNTKCLAPIRPQPFIAAMSYRENNGNTGTTCESYVRLQENEQLHRGCAGAVEATH